jgi:hypothetical protein
MTRTDDLNATRLMALARAGDIGLLWLAGTRWIRWDGSRWVGDVAFPEVTQ